MAMPEATVYENDLAFSRKNNIGLAGQLFSMQSIPKAIDPKPFSHNKFRLGVFVPDARHTMPSLGFGKHIRHFFNCFERTNSINP